MVILVAIIGFTYGFQIGDTPESRFNSFLILLVFIAGVLTSFTPCVYPLIPVTVSFIGARSAGSKQRGFILSLFYVLGLASVYSSLGLFAVFTGRIFGAINSNPITMIVMAIFFIVLALITFDVFRFNIADTDAMLCNKVLQ